MFNQNNNNQQQQQPYQQQQIFMQQPYQNSQVMPYNNQQFQQQPQQQQNQSQQQIMFQIPQQQYQFQQNTQLDTVRKEQQSMLNPMMPQQNQSQLPQLSPEEKINQLKSITIRENAKSGCSEMAWCKYQTVHWEIIDDNNNNKNNSGTSAPADFMQQIANLEPSIKAKFVIQQNSSSNCQNIMGGKISDYTTNNMNQEMSREIYKLQHNRNKCGLKCCLGSPLWIGGIIYTLLGRCYKPTSQLIKDDQTIANFEYGGCCGDQVSIYDENMAKKYEITSQSCYCGSRQRFVTDKQGQKLELNAASYYFGFDRNSKLSSTIDFTNSNIEPNDRMAIIFGLAKLT